MHWLNRHNSDIYTPMSRPSQPVQVGESPAILRARISNSAEVYSNRRDTLSLKDRLLAIVGDSDYWNTLSCFLHGQYSKPQFDAAMSTYLRTTEAKVLHNELIRSIIYNSHFAMHPPSNVEVPPLEAPLQPKKVPPTPAVRLERPLVTNTATDLRHLPSVTQLSDRMAFLLGPRKLTADRRATMLLFSQMKKYALQLLEQGCALVILKGEGKSREALVTTKQLLHVISENRELASVISPTIFTKYANVV
jgi:hypothetical protein